MVFIEESESLRTALIRLCAAEDTLLFRTPEKILCMIRTATDGMKPDELNFDICIVSESEPSYITTCLKNDSDAVSSEVGDFYVIEEFICQPDDIETIDAARRKLNEMYTWSVCPCCSYFIKDKKSTCIMCEMTRSKDQSQDDFCVICHEHGHDRWMATTPCCKQRMHTMCLNQWQQKSETCAYCRTPHVGSHV